MNIRSRQGSMLLMAFYVIVSLLAISAAFVMLMVNERLSMTRQLKAQQAHALAEAGIEKAIYELRADFRGNHNWFDGNINGKAVTQSTVDHYELLSSTPEANGAFTVWLKNIQGKTDHIWIKSQGMVGDAKASLGVYVTAVNPADWTVQVVMWQKI